VGSLGCSGEQGFAHLGAAGALQADEHDGCHIRSESLRDEVVVGVAWIPKVAFVGQEDGRGVGWGHVWVERAQHQDGERAA
jgi:hypothetical protein